MKVVATDYTFPSLDVEKAILEPLGCQFDARHCETQQELIDLVADADCVITQFAPVDASVIAAMRQARAIVRYGIGVDNVDLQAARARGIPVCNVPDYCIDEVADHTLALMLALTRQIVPHCLGIRAGHWRLATPVQAIRSLRELTIGIIGFGRIGRAVASRLQAFKCKVLVHDPLVAPHAIEQAGCRPSGLDELLASVHMITLHCPSNAQTRRLLNGERLSKVARGALLINVARGDVIESAALVEALRDGRLAGAALDVFDPEPIPANHPLLAMDQVLFSPHIASVSAPAMLALRTGVAQTAASALRGDPLPNVVNGVPG